MKKKLLQIGLSLACIAILSACNTGSIESSNGEIADDIFSAPDYLGGGGIASAGELTSLSYNNYFNESYKSVADDEKNTSTEGTTLIDLSTLVSGDYDGYSLSKKGKLSITAAGEYTLSGNLSGYVSVDAVADDVRIVLNNVNIKVPDTVASAAIVFKGSDTETVGRRVLTIYPGTTNTLEDSVFDTETNEGDEAVIQAKKSTSLTINGNGKLILNGKATSSSGIKLKEKLLIYGVDIEINANNNGIKANKTLVIIDSSLKVIALNDGIKTDMDATTSDEALLYAADLSYGYMYINNSSIDVNALDDGIVANNCLYIDNDEDDLIKVITNGGAPSSVTEQSKNSASGKGIKTGGITLTSGTNETDYKSSFEDNYGLVIAGGSFEINTNSDAISSKGNTLITDGAINISTGDDGVHSEYLTKITGGTIDISKSYEGVEGASVEITGGTVKVTAFDDGINAANGDLRGYSNSLYISGGNVSVNASGDGLDSNGTLTITGGNVYVSGPASGANAALDSDNGILINGGNVIALGCLGMVENPGSNSSQCFISINMTQACASDTVIKVLSSDKATVLCEATALKSFQSVILSLPSLAIGTNYYVMVGSTEYEANITSISTVIGSYSGGFGGGGNRPGGGFPR